MHLLLTPLSGPVIVTTLKDGIDIERHFVDRPTEFEAESLTEVRAETPPYPDPQLSFRF